MIPRYRFILKTALTSLVVIGTNVVGNYGLRYGLQRINLVATWSPMAYIHAFSDHWVLLGMLFMIGWFVSRLVLLSWADLSYVLPVTSFSYVLSAIVGALYLGEQVSNMHWGAICIITLGVALTALTFPETTVQPKETQ